ncbi:hypothetical protein [Paenibacillus koleovorans]|uniref:hypothetical protein n=1 Tax=Paenibacillus koleovorans TaxID=121608 RepID=UPI000FD7E97E|nr:hypothetical protein [Paenibacillus koleovorans]
MNKQTKFRLDQGPFEIDQDEGWATIATTTPSDKHIRNVGLGMVGYTWEENGPSVKARNGEESLEQHIEKMATLPFADVLYIRCDWRDVQSRPGKLDLHPVWKLTEQAAKQYGLRVAFRVQLSNYSFQPERLAMPDFLLDQVPVAPIGRTKDGHIMREPIYNHPAFMKAFQELNELLAEQFNHTRTEFMDLMMYGFWGEGHTSQYPHPLSSDYEAELTFMKLAQLQIDTWDKVPLAVNTQPDISRVGNRAVQRLAIDQDCWLRTDSILIEEPCQVQMLNDRPPTAAAILEDGYYRHYDTKRIPIDAAGINAMESNMLHALNVGANYWSMWTESDNLAAYNEQYPAGIRELQKRMGYRLRPAWVWQRKRYGTDELVIALANDGVSSVPGTVWLTLTGPDDGHKLHLSGCLDPGHPYAGKLRQAAFVLPPGMDGRTVRLSAELETKPGVRHPLNWACAQPVHVDRSITIQLKAHNESGWRKGV